MLIDGLRTTEQYNYIVGFIIETSVVSMLKRKKV